MAIQRHPARLKKVKLPPAHLYLDDVEEIIGILRPEGEADPPALQFTVDDQYCDSVDDLRKIGEQRVGGRSRCFEMSVQWKEGRLRDRLEIEPRWRAELSLSGPSQRRMWVGSQILGVFTRRACSRWRFRWMVFLGTAVVYLGAFHLLFQLLDKMPCFRDNARYYLYVDILVGLLGGWLLVFAGGRFVGSVVSLTSFQAQGGLLRRYRDQILVAAITALITNPIAILVAFLIHKWLTPK